VGLSGSTPLFGGAPVDGRKGGFQAWTSDLAGLLGLERRGRRDARAPAQHHDRHPRSGRRRRPRSGRVRLPAGMAGSRQRSASSGAEARAERLDRDAAFRRGQGGRATAPIAADREHRLASVGRHAAEHRRRSRRRTSRQRRQDRPAEDGGQPGTASVATHFTDRRDRDAERGRRSRRGLLAARTGRSARLRAGSLRRIARPQRRIARQLERGPRPRERSSGTFRRIARRRSLDSAAWPRALQRST